MQRAAKAAEPERMEQRDRLDQENQRIMRLIENKKCTHHPADMQRKTFCWV